MKGKIHGFLDVVMHTGVGEVGVVVLTLGGMVVAFVFEFLFLQYKARNPENVSELSVLKNKPM
jgi:hypothetical protein